MQKINVKGIGVLNFPDGMSDDEIESAIKTHPKYKEAASLSLPEQSTLQKIGTGAKIAAQGIPIAGRFIDDTPETVRFKRENPALSTGLDIAGGVTSTLPLTGPLAVAGAGAKGLGLIGSLFASGALGGAIGAGDKVADNIAKGKEQDGDEILGEGLLGFSGGMLGPAVGKVLSPGLRKATTAKAIKSALLYGLGGTALGFNPVISALVGGAGRYLGTNTLLNRPTSQAILSALSTNAGTRLDLPEK